MPEFARFDTEIRDVYRNFMYSIKFDGKEVAACRKMSGLDATVNVVEFRAGNSGFTNVERSPGRVEYQAVTFEAGKTNSTHFEDWANALITHEQRSERKREVGFRRDVVIEVRDIDNTPVLKYKLFKAWVTKYTALSDLAGDGNDSIIETLEVTHEGFERIAVPSDGGGEAEAGG